MSFLSDLHADLRNARLTYRGSTQHPDSVPRGVHKTYARMKRVPLERSPEALRQSLGTLLEKRHSASAMRPDAVSALEWSVLLAGLASHDDPMHRKYPSGGALFPIETYVVAFTPGDVSGVLHYNPGEHALERLWDIPEGIAATDLIYAEAEVHPGAVVLFTGVWERASAKYGDFAYMLALLEAGHMSENILLAATTLTIGARPIIGFDDKLVHQLLDIDEYVEQPILTIAIGKEGTGLRDH